MKAIRYVAGGALGAALVMSTLSTARADTIVTSQPAPQARETSSVTTPNMGLIGTGIITLGVPYIASVVVAAQSDHSGDKNLYVPVAGPWIDLGNRGGCDGVGQTNCTTETGYKILLVADGLIQAVGALEIVGGFLFPTTRTTVANNRPTLRLAPTAGRDASLGVTAFGTF